MLKKIVLVGALAVASFLSLNFAAHSTSTATTPTTSAPLAAKWPPCDPNTGWGCATAQP